MEFPKKQDVYTHLKTIQKFLIKNGIAETDVRLQIYEDGAWVVREGDSSYDQDHRGYWGVSGVGIRHSKNDLMTIALDLIDQAEGQHFDDL